MPDLLWNDVREWLDLQYEAANLPDGRVAGTTLADWTALVTLADEQGWRLEIMEDGRLVPTPGQPADVFARADEVSLTMRLWPVPEIQVNVWFYVPEEIIFD